MKLTVSPSVLKGQITVPSSKSMAHRVLIVAALSKKPCVISNLSSCDDIRATLNCLSALGAQFEEQNSTVRFLGNTLSNKRAILNCCESGSTLRFLLPVALLNKGEYLFTGTERLLYRGVSVYKDILSPKGIEFSTADNGIFVKGKLEAGEYTVPGNISSQYVTGLLLALTHLKDDSVIKVLPPFESKSYVSLTVSTLKSMGIIVTEGENNTYFIKGGQKTTIQEQIIEGDWSNASCYFALNALDADIQINGLNAESLQGDKRVSSFITALLRDAPQIDLSDNPDLGPVLFALAALKNGAVFTGTQRLRLKESDRVNEYIKELSKFGIVCEVTDNAVHVYPCEIKKPNTELYGHNDHRVIMALFLLCCVTGGTIKGCRAVNKSYPGFFDDMARLGAKISIK